ncbi:adenosine-3'(2'),5'-bisphosphate nucleotidase [Campylobacter avium LMG 24591]|uniref:3'(2'),5-bisphosphonucleoside 3'(2')-phosphohydrolase n=1 Tax=Campylobacter avium LMG 24591 TaxID=522484 RepID=A0A222MYE4_9BACT|nr:3'(2'),5'-bisphosphate nucleotidase CysQ [Campylobacter avium]ASQ31164.1 adenosine-3'(2'),5'-bisphosphate nucleotidase [Campylobacter avium LMG 24591]OYD78548.1 adenosine-3'(2'),5'-bisphosphate nucleotidase [Campylobacter avium]
MKLNSLLELALEASNEASKAILKEKENLKIWQKKDLSPLSSADVLANELISEILGKSDIKICSEEEPLNYELRKNLKRFWLVDPLDGTKGFIKGSDEYCILIALIEEQRPILALIQKPSTGEVFYAHKDSPVYKNDKILQKDEAKFQKNKNKALVSVHHPNAKNQDFLDKNSLSTLKISSALKFCSLLEAEAGLYLRFESLNSWDIAAGDFLLNQNEGLMCKLDKSLLEYNKESFLCPSFIALAKKEYLKDIKF